MTETETVPTEPEALPPRGGRLALIFVAVIVVGAGIGLAVRSAFQQADELARSESFAQSFPPGPLAGQPAPAFEVELLDGSTFRLSQHVAEDGRPLVLNFWFPSCPPCRVEMPEFNRLAARTPEVAFLSVGGPYSLFFPDTRSDAVAFAEEFGLTYPIAWDESETVRAAYAAVRFPQTWVINPDGTIARVFIGAVTEEWLAALLEEDLGLTPRS